MNATATKAAERTLKVVCPPYEGSTDGFRGPGFTATVTVRFGRIVHATGMLHWMVGKPENYLLTRCRSSKWSVEEVR